MARFPSRLPLIAVLLGLAAGAATASRVFAADSEPYRLTLSGAFQVERLNSPYADSLGITMSHANRGILGFDFRVLDLPMKGAERPAVHVFGNALTTRRTVAILGVPGAPASATPLREIPVTEMTAGAALVLPMSMVTPGAGANLYAGYQGSLVLAGGTSQDFLRVKQVMFGFERTRGLFEGSLTEMAYGRNESWGLANASNRWAARFRIQTLLGPAAAPAARPVAGKPAVAPARPTTGSPLRAFVELAVDTDGGPGADGIQAQLGLMLDAGSMLMRAMGTRQ